MSETRNVYQCISRVQSAIAQEGIAKDRKNQTQNYTFRGIDDVYNALCGLLADAGLVIVPRVVRHRQVERATKSGGALFYTLATVEYDFISAHDGSKHTARVVGEAMDSADKSTNKALSAAYKYVCMQVFCIPTEGGSLDSENDHYDVSREAAAKEVAEKKLAALRSQPAPQAPSTPPVVPDPYALVTTTKLRAMQHEFLNADKFRRRNLLKDLRAKIGGEEPYRAILDTFGGAKKSTELEDSSDHVQFYYSLLEVYQGYAAVQSVIHALHPQTATDICKEMVGESKTWMCNKETARALYKALASAKKAQDNAQEENHAG